MGHALTLMILPGEWAVCRLSPGDPVPGWAASGRLLSITRTADELSVVCEAAAVPGDVRSERGWICFKVAGPIDFALTGVVASFAGPLAGASIPVFILSTFDTDYLLIRSCDRVAAVDALREAGHRVEVGVTASEMEEGAGRE